MTLLFTRRRASWPIKQLSSLDDRNLSALQLHDTLNTNDRLATARLNYQRQCVASLQIYYQRLTMWVAAKLVLDVGTRSWV
jgi:hypothetical protein